MKKLFVIVAILSALIACSREQAPQAVSTLDADVVDVLDSEVVSLSGDVTEVGLCLSPTSVN
jgi:hypothetical protein